MTKLNFLDPLKAFIEILKFIAGLSSENKRENKEALEALLLATYSTKAYLADSRVDGRKREVERILSEQWIKAAVSLKHIRINGPEFADKCLLKADYWSDPDLWENQKKTLAEIDLDEICTKARELLGQL
jgi:hypothetical protein